MKKFNIDWVRTVLVKMVADNMEICEFFYSMCVCYMYI